jgi:poly(hydroxyalkanoate) granule-associated protein
MVTKKKSSKSNKADSQLAAAVKESAQQIWLAGLGAFAKAQEEGNKVFEALVREGRDLQGRTRSVTEEKLGEVTGRFGKVAGGFSKQATASWDRLEQVFEERVARALSRLGVPTQAEVQALIERVDALNASVQALGGKPTRTRRSAAATEPQTRSARSAAASTRAPRTTRAGAAATNAAAPKGRAAKASAAKAPAAKAPAAKAPAAKAPAAKAAAAKAPAAKAPATRKPRAPRAAAAPAAVAPAAPAPTGSDNA